MTEKNVKQVEPQESASASSPVPQLTLSDLVNMLQIVEAATSRGAFKAPELSTIGGVYDRVSAYVKHVSPKPEKTAEGVQEGAAASE